MTHQELVEYLRSMSERCRSYSDRASDAEAARTLRELADGMATAALALESEEPAQTSER